LILTIGGSRRENGVVMEAVEASFPGVNCCCAVLTSC
jgi:hypothetical protein